MFTENVRRPTAVESFQPYQPTQPERHGRCRWIAEEPQLLFALLLEMHGHLVDVDFGRPGRRRRLSNRYTVPPTEPIIFSFKKETKKQSNQVHRFVVLISFLLKNKQTIRPLRIDPEPSRRDQVVSLRPPYNFLLSAVH